MGSKKSAVSIVDKTAVVNINSPKAMSDFATQLKLFVVKNKLYTEIKGKNFVHVEGWQFAGASMGIFPVVEKLENVSVDTEIKYRAEVKLIQIASGTVVGYGVALCSNKENKKKDFDEYALASMAQTRATGKAFRLSLGWIMKLAGYEATPAEEASNSYIEVDSGDSKTSVEELPISDVKLIVDSKMATMTAAEKVKFVRDSIGTVKTDKLEDSQYRHLYDSLNDLRKEKEGGQS